MKYEVGDTVVITDNVFGHDYEIGSKVKIIEVSKADYIGDGKGWSFTDLECKAYNPLEVIKDKKLTGGPNTYYDMPFSSWVTTNDQMEYLAKNKWGIYSIHLKDIFKGLCRWGDKSGTTTQYDSEKVIYYGCRVLKMIIGVDGLRDYLQKLLDDEQFKGTS